MSCGHNSGHHRMQLNLRAQQVGALATQSWMLQLSGRQLNHRKLTNLRPVKAQQQDDQAETLQQVDKFSARSQVQHLAAA